MRQLYAEGKLDSLQAGLFQSHRPPEELYDLQEDSYETHNLANNQNHQKNLTEMRQLHIQEMERTKDMGLIPKPLLEELGKKYGNKYFVLQQPRHRTHKEYSGGKLSKGRKGKLMSLSNRSRRVLLQ